MKITTIYFDLDGTLADTYGVENWLPLLRAESTVPYEQATPMCNFKLLARLLNKLQDNGYRIGIVSWLSKESTPEYNEAVRKAKRRWLAKHLPSVDWDEVHMVKYGTPKQYICSDKSGILFDDEEQNRANWKGTAYPPETLLSVLASLV